MVIVSLRQVALLKFLSVIMLTTLSQSFDRDTDSLMIRNKAKSQKKAFPYSSADHYWPLNKLIKIPNKKSVFIKDVFGLTNADVSEGVTTKFDDQLGRVVSLNAKDDSLVMDPLKSRCISDPTTCRMGITVGFWLKFRKGECILSAGGYTKRPEGPGFILINNPKKRRLVLELSTTSKLWTLELNVKRSWVHLMFTWKQKMGLVLYENGEFLTEAKTFQRIRYPSFTYKYRTLTVGAQDNLMKLKSGGVFEIGHLVIWTRSLSAKQIQSKSFLHVVRRSVRSIICCEQKYEDRCISDACYYIPRCNNIDEKYPCICPNIKPETKDCGNETPVKPCRDTAKDCSTLARQPNYCNYYLKKMRTLCSKSCQFCGTSTSTVGLPTVASDEDSKTIIVAIAVGVACVVMLLVIIAIVMARMNSKMQGEFIPNPHENGTISPDNNTHEMIAAAVDPAPRITDVPYKSPKATKTTKVQLKQSDFMTSEI